MPLKIMRDKYNIRFTCASCDYEESHETIHIAEEKYGWRCTPFGEHEEVTECYCAECVSERMLEAVHKRYGVRDISYQELVEAQEEWYYDTES